MAVDSVLSVMSYLAHNPGEHGVRAIAAALGLTPSTVHRTLNALERSGFARQNVATGRYSVGFRTVEVGLAAMESFDLTAVAPRFLQELTAETGETSFLAVRDGRYIVYVLKEEGSHAIRTTSQLGSRRPVHCTALGKTFLADLPDEEVRALLDGATLERRTPNTITSLPDLIEDLRDIRERGYAVDREEIEVGLTCFAAPIRDLSDRAVAAMSLAGPTPRMVASEERFSALLRSAAAEISAVLGYTGRRSAPV